MSLPAAEPITIQYARSLLPSLSPDRNKYSAGQVLLCGGFPGMEGAAWLAGQAILLSGAGIVKWVKEGVGDPPAPAPEIVQLDAGAGFEHVLHELARTKALLVGVGTTPSPPPNWLAELVQAAQERHIPILWDGAAFAWMEQGWVAPQDGDCLTPHAGELARLTPMGVHDRQRAAYEVAERWGATVVAKGPITWVVQTGAATLAANDGDPGMATAGTGDVLAGLIAGLIAQGLGAREAAALAVWIHNAAGREAARDRTSYCLNATALLGAIPKAFSQLLTSA
jgi:hydroxyethylthiazole kinase-like uncharacterized protein yjeF